MIAAVRRTLLKAVQQVKDGKEAPGLIRNRAEGLFHDFICTSAYVEDHEDGPKYCRRILAGKAAAE